MIKMKKSYIFSLLAATALFTVGCSKEHPFDGPGSGSEGQFLKSAIAVDIDADGLEVRTTRAAEANIDDFKVIFNSESLTQPVTYRYGDMPEVVTLPAGDYTVTASYGENREADWENPHFLGTSDKFTVSALEITSYIEPIVCHLENIKVTIDFDSVLRQHMSPDSYAEVKVGSSSALRFGLDEADKGKAGYFSHQEEISLVAVFKGTVDGAKIVETKSMTDIQKGAHYKITFRLHEGSEPDFNGDASLGGVTVDAVVDATDVNRNVPLVDDEVLDDSERPREGDEPGKDNPGKDDPVNPDDPAKTPEIIGQAPVNIDVVNNGNDLNPCIFRVYSYDPDGIVELICDIDSPVLPGEDLRDLGLDDHLDLVNTDDEMCEKLKDFGFPYKVRGQHEVEFDLSEFVPILGGFGSYLHKFTITVRDASGSCTKTLQIQF